MSLCLYACVEGLATVFHHFRFLTLVRILSNSVDHNTMMILVSYMFGYYRITMVYYKITIEIGYYRIL